MESRPHPTRRAAHEPHPHRLGPAAAFGRVAVAAGWQFGRAGDFAEKRRARCLRRCVRRGVDVARRSTPRAGIGATAGFGDTPLNGAARPVEERPRPGERPRSTACGSRCTAAVARTARCRALLQTVSASRTRAAACSAAALAMDKLRSKQRVCRQRAGDTAAGEVLAGPDDAADTGDRAPRPAAVRQARARGLERGHDVAWTAWTEAARAGLWRSRRGVYDSHGAGRANG
jgi:hypothetical protein